MAVRWYLAYSLSYRNIEELMAERCVCVDHSTTNSWVIKYSPFLEKEFTNKQKHLVGRSWRMDDTYIKVKGKWWYLYRSVDKNGATIDLMLSKKRDKKAANKFFIKAIGYAGTPEKVTIDKSGSINAVLQSIKCQEKPSTTCSSNRIFE
jgi:putative transposase